LIPHVCCDSRFLPVCRADPAHPTVDQQRVSAAERPDIRSTGEWTFDARRKAVLVQDTRAKRADVIDATDGTVLSSIPIPQEIADIELSPNGRYVATATNPEEIHGRPECVGPTWGNMTTVYDRETGETRILRDCTTPFVVRMPWMPDGRHLALLTTGSFQREGVDWQATLFDLVTGTDTPMTNGLECYGGVVPSPDGSRLITTGDSLRVSTADGRLLRSIPEPAHLDVQQAIWSHNVRENYFLVGPHCFFEL
jgi:hypothetical protein